MKALFKKMILGSLGLGVSFYAISAHASSYINTDSFWLVEGDGGYGKLLDQNVVPWSAGGGYQWEFNDAMTLGFEGLYMDNGTWTEGQNSAKSTAVVPFVSIYYYVTPKANIFAKLGYGYEMNSYEVSSVSSTVNAWQPAGIIGTGYLIPFSKVAYLNLFADLAWMQQKNDVSTELSDPTVLKNMQFKVGMQLMF